MMNLKKRIWAWLIIPCLCFNSVALTSCDEDTVNTVLEVVEEILKAFGYDPTMEDVDDQEKADELDIVTSTKVSYESKFPPIGNQGSYGTCVAWASAYNLQTALNVIDGIWTNPTMASQQCSPVDLWHLLPSGDKSVNCGGSNFDPAFKTMMQKGCATMSQQPFTNSKMTCDGVSGKGSSLKLGSYRIIAYSAEMSSNGSNYGMTPENIKAHLQKGPLVVGAKLGDRFMNWNSSDVITDDNDTYKGQHAYHAMAVVGFDDNKKAFRLRNSWGADDWGDNGSVWVGYNFFVSRFAFGVWAASNDASATYASESTENDVKATVLSDKANADGSRTVTYKISNNGSNAISTGNYPIVYILFKAKHFAMRYNLMDGAEEATVQPRESVTLTHTYNVPNDVEDGKYFCVLIADPYNEMNDGNRNNNFAFVSGESQLPFYISQNKFLGMPATIKECHTLVNSQNLNAYRNMELENALIHEKNKK